MSKCVFCGDEKAQLKIIRDLRIQVDLLKESAASLMGQRNAAHKEAKFLRNQKVKWEND